MKIGNFLGLPVNFLLFAIIVVIVTAGSVKVFGQMIMDPVEIVSRIDNKVAVFIGSVTFIIATMGINIVANFVSPAYDIANLFPKHIDFKQGGLSPRSSRCWCARGSSSTARRRSPFSSASSARCWPRSTG